MTEDSAPSGVKTYKRLLSYVARYWLAFLLSVFGLVLHSAAEIALP
jgi:subfamily B ATP-binding cassette protein MsbA